MKKKIAFISIFILLLCGAAVAVFYTRAASDEPTLTELVEAGRDPAIEKMLDSMTTEEKVGQMIMGCFYNGTPDPETVDMYHLGSVLLFRPSFTSGDASSLRASLDAIDEACAVDPLIAVDEEGGTVVRVSGGTSFRAGAFDSPRNVFSSGGLEAIEKDTHEKNALLSELGIDLNLAPVCDISTDPSDFMYSRSLGQDAETTSQYVKTVVKACLEDDMGCCLKHFPGYGNAMDTHYGAAVNDRTMKQIREEDLMPFKAGIKAGAPSVLISHNIVSALDDRMPASLSPAVHNLLRYDMGFDGVVITDDMSMGAIYAFTQGADSAVTAVLAGNDMLCTGEYAYQYEMLLDAVEDGVISGERLDSSVRRILTWKKDLSLI